MKKKNIVQKIEEVVSVIILSFMTILTFVNVVSRYLLKGSLSFTDELTTLLFVLLTMLGSAIAARKGSHLGLTVITDITPKKYHKWVHLCTGICSFIFCVIVIYFGIKMVIFEYQSKQLTLGIQLPEWIFGTFVPIGGIFVAFEFLKYSLNRFKEKGDN